MKKIIIGIIVFVVSLPVLALGSYTWMNSEKFQVAGTIISRVDTQEKIVALTFDDGPNEYTEVLLKALADQDVKATFYLIGENIDANKAQTQQIVKAGHELGNHSYTHQRMILKSDSFIAEEVEKTNQLIKEAGYSGEITFRPPYGKKLLALPRYLAKHNIKTITWDVEPLKYLPADPAVPEIVEYVVATTKPGSIILIHPWYGEKNTSRDAVPEIIRRLKSEGYRFVTVGQLLDTI